MEPAITIVSLLGGPTKLASLLGIHRVRVSNWMRPKEKGGTGGQIPLRHWNAVIKAAQDAGINLTFNDLVRPEEVRP